MVRELLPGRAAGVSEDEGPTLRLLPIAREEDDAPVRNAEPGPWCPHRRVEVDEEAGRVRCRECEREVDPVGVLVKLGREWERYTYHYEGARARAKKAEREAEDAERRARNAKSRARRAERGEPYLERLAAFLHGQARRMRWLRATDGERERIEDSGYARRTYEEEHAMTRSYYRDLAAKLLSEPEEEAQAEVVKRLREVPP